MKALPEKPSEDASRPSPHPDPESPGCCSRCAVRKSYIMVCDFPGRQLALEIMTPFLMFPSSLGSSAPES